MKLEVIGFNIESCLSAYEAGADRIELCSNPSEGGVTPSHGLITSARKNVDIELYVMVRPRGGDFAYSEQELQVMQHDIKMIKEAGCDGIVIGVLTQDGKVDKAKCERLVSYAYPLGVTFHRAFDRVENAEEALEDIIETGCERILTSGLRPKAPEGVELIKKLVSLGEDRIIIMPGSGVNAENIVWLAENTGAIEFHSSASHIKKSEMQVVNDMMQESLGHIVVNKEDVRQMKTLLNAYRQPTP